MKLVCISDTHGSHARLDMPEGDVLIHCGDATGFGELNVIRDLAKWGDSLPYAQKIFVPGNHDFCFDSRSKLYKFHARRVMEEGGWTVLIDQTTTIRGSRELKVYGSPWIPNLERWAFYDEGKNRFSHAPEDIDILVTHGPPFGVRDGVEDVSGLLSHYGSRYLLDYVGRCPKLLLHAFGHTHAMGGVSRRRPWFCNAAVMDEMYEVVRNPVVIDLEDIR